jgi:hypothetical protein
MKIKSTKVCRRKGCYNEFKLYRSTDKFCSAACAYADQQAKPKKEVKAVKPIKKASDKRKRESYLYTQKKNIFLALPENKYCPVAEAVYQGKIPANQFQDSELVFNCSGYFLTNQVHHKAGRKGKLLNYVPYWLAVCQFGHDWIHANPEQAYKLGFSIKASTVNL